jgi:phage shock protein A
MQQEPCSRPPSWSQAAPASDRLRALLERSERALAQTGQRILDLEAQIDVARARGLDTQAAEELVRTMRGTRDSIAENRAAVMRMLSLLERVEGSPPCSPPPQQNPAEAG